MADAEEGLVKGDTSDEPTTYGSADTGTTDKPPPFDAVPGEDPPSYKSVMQELRDAKKTSSGTVDLASKVLTILINTVLFTVLMALALAIPIAMIIVGAVHVNDCPVQSLIPVYLIVSGCIHIVKTLLDLCVRYKRKRNGEDADLSFNAYNSVSRIFACILLVFFILGKAKTKSVFGCEFIFHRGRERNEGGSYVSRKQASGSVLFALRLIPGP